MDQEQANSQTEEKLAELEAVLFVHGEPIQLKKICSVLNIGREELENLILLLDGKLRGEERGLTISSQIPLDAMFDKKGWEDRKIQLVTKPRFGDILEKFVKEEMKEDLTPASLEALSLIAYLGPVSKSDLEYVRGVNSSFILRNLMLRGLVEKSGESGPGGVPLYRLSFDCMKDLGIQDPRELPEYEKFRSVFEEYKEGPKETVDEEEVVIAGMAEEKEEI